MKILAFDVGSRWNGWAVVETGQPIRRIASGQQHSDSLKESFGVVLAVLADWPDAVLVAVEKSFPPKASTKNWEETAQVRGAIKAAMPAGVDLAELTAQQVRSRLGITPLTGHKKSLSFLRGMTADARVKAAVEKLFGCKVAGAHEADALALAWAVGVGL